MTQPTNPLPRPPAARRRHPAANARRNATGIAVCATFGLVGVLGFRDALAGHGGLTATGTASTTATTSTGTGTGTSTDETSSSSSSSSTRVLPGTGTRASNGIGTSSGTTNGSTHGSR